MVRTGTVYLRRYRVAAPFYFQPEMWANSQRDWWSPCRI